MSITRREQEEEWATLLDIPTYRDRTEAEELRLTELTAALYVRPADSAASKRAGIELKIKQSYNSCTGEQRVDGGTLAAYYQALIDLDRPAALPDSFEPQPATDAGEADREAETHHARYGF